MSSQYLPPALFVTWQDPASRKVHPVGRLVHVLRPESSYEFTYLRAAREAAECGFTPFVGFPNFEELYLSRELPPFFENRLMPSSRAQFKVHLAELGLDSSATEETILARSGGRRVTDPYEVFAEFEPTAHDGEWQTWFFVRSLRYLEHPEVLNDVRVGQRLFCMLDVQNRVNKRAVALRTNGNTLIGFAPDYLADSLGPILETSDLAVVSVARVNPEPAPLQHRIQCQLVVRLTEDFHAYRTGRFEPIPNTAVRLDAWPRVAAA